MAKGIRRRIVAVGIVACSIAFAADTTMSSLDVEPDVTVLAHQVGMGTVSFVNVANPTAGSLTIETIGPCPAGMSVTGTLPMTIDSGGSNMLQVSCGASLPVGFHRCDVDLRDQASSIGSFVLICNTSTMPALSGSPNPISFGSQAVGALSSPQTITISKPSMQISTTLHLQLDDLDGNFLIGAPCQDELYCAPSVSLGSGSSALVDVYCRPTSVGSQSAKLYAFTEDHFSLGTPITLTCFGQSVSMPVYNRSPAGNPAASLSAQVNAQTDSVTITVSNVGSGSGVVDVDAVSLVGPNATDWSISSIAGACNQADCSLGMMQTLAIAVDFNPSQLGDRSINMRIDHDGTSDTFTLQGTGVGATATLVSAASIDFGTIPLNTPTTAQVEIDNQGNIAGSATFMLSGQTAPFTLSTPGTQLPVSPNTTIGVTCGSNQPGTAMATLHVIPGANVITPPFDIPLRCDLKDTAFYALPSTIELGDLRTGAPATSTTVQVFGPAITIESIDLETASPNLAISAASPPGITPSSFDLVVMPTADEQITNAIIVTPASSSGQTAIRIPVTGNVGTASFSAPEMLSLGTFCVHLPTTPAMVSLQSTGTAPITVSAPVLADPSSPLELDAAQLAMYPLTLAQFETARIDVTPKRSDVPGMIGDTLQWTTDAGSATTMLAATFIADGAAVTPDRIDFQKVEIHLDAQNAVNVHLQNCNEEPIDLDPAVVPPPFSIDNGDPPDGLAPGETAVFAVGFHPTDRGVYEKELVITSPQLANPLVVTLIGEGVAGSGSGSNNPDLPLTSFYACGCAGSRDPSGVLAIAVALGCALVPRRRRRR